MRTEEEVREKEKLLRKGIDQVNKQLRNLEERRRESSLNFGPGYDLDPPSLNETLLEDTRASLIARLKTIVWVLGYD